MQRIRKRQSNLLLHVIARHSAQGLRSHLTLLRHNKRGSLREHAGLGATPLFELSTAPNQEPVGGRGAGGQPLA